MNTPNALNPTLWRTCRVLASPTRIRLLRHLLEHPGLNVSEMARATGIGESAASQELRRLQSRGLLQRQRTGASVSFRPVPDPQVSSAAPLLSALQKVLAALPAEQDANLCRLAMGLGHERRLQIARELAQSPGTFSELRRVTGIPRDSLMRHLRRMEEAHLVGSVQRRYRLEWPRHPLARALARLL